jgi:MFS family permease
MMTMLVVGVLLHGFSYDFVFISGYLYVDRHVPEKIRAQAQGLLVVFTQGLGFFISSQIFVNYVFPKVQKADPLETWKAFWMTPVIYLLVILVLFALIFREKKTEAGAAG